MDERNEVAPRVAMLDQRRGALAVEAPARCRIGLRQSEANRAFVDGPQLDLRLRKGLEPVAYLLADLRQHRLLAGVRSRSHVWIEALHHETAVHHIEIFLPPVDRRKRGCHKQRLVAYAAH